MVLCIYVSGYILLGMKFLSIIWGFGRGYQGRRCLKIKCLSVFALFFMLWGNLHLMQRLRAASLAAMMRCVNLSLALANSCPHAPPPPGSHFSALYWQKHNLDVCSSTLTISCPCLSKDCQERIWSLWIWVTFIFLSVNLAPMYTVRKSNIFVLKLNEWLLDFKN